METDEQATVISTETFYGTNKFKHTDSNESKSTISKYKPVPYKLQRLLGPTSIWKVFKKQSEALHFINSKNCSSLMPFVFQQTTGERLFLACHPSWLWHYDSQKNPAFRSSYEIIPEFTVCKLYFDLEFEYCCNPLNDGDSMIETFLNIVFYFIKTTWNLNCSRKNVIDLDSSTDSKFSRHLIFNLPNAAFRDNYNVGEFVKFVCRQIRDCADLNSNISRESIQMLQIKDSKGNVKLFCDEGVYTKNRHFRLFKSTKPGKNAPLVISKQNEFIPSALNGNSVEEQMFLDSLITYITNDSLRILHFISDMVNEKSAQRTNRRHCPLKGSSTSPFPKIDEFIQGFLSPGRIWRSFYFQATNTIVYDVIGNRYCGNIGRQHKSNNIKIIVDINSRNYYQKCYDPDCSGYRSDTLLLPPEIQFYLEDDVDATFPEQSLFLEDSSDNFESNLNISEQELSEVVDIVEEISFSCNKI